MGYYRGYSYGFAPYVPVATRRKQAAKEVARRAKNGEKVSPVQIEGRTIAKSFWGKSWCEHLESYSDYENRLPRGRTYVRNGSVVDLQIREGKITALVSGSSLYKINIEISCLAAKKWTTLKELCAGKVGSLVELLQGKLSSGVMELVSDRDQGMFPKPSEIKLRCSCPDGAYLCKHLAAVLYGVGNRLDSQPELLFLLRGVDHLELIEQAVPVLPKTEATTAPTLESNELGAIFGIEIGDTAEPETKPTTKKRTPKAPKPEAKKKQPTTKEKPPTKAPKKPKKLAQA